MKRKFDDVESETNNKRYKNNNADDCNNINSLSTSELQLVLDRASHLCHQGLKGCQITNIGNCYALVIQQPVRVTTKTIRDFLNSVGCRCIDSEWQLSVQPQLVLRLLPLHKQQQAATVCTNIHKYAVDRGSSGETTTELKWNSNTKNENKLPTDDAGLVEPLLFYAKHYLGDKSPVESLIKFHIKDAFNVNSTELKFPVKQYSIRIQGWNECSLEHLENFQQMLPFHVPSVEVDGSDVIVYMQSYRNPLKRVYLVNA